MDTNIISLFSRLWKYRRTVFIVTAAGFLLGILMAVTVKKKYDVVAKVMPEAVNQKTSLGSLSSIGAALANLQNNTDAIYPEVFPDIIRSYPFIAELMAMDVTFLHNGDSVHTNLYDYKLNYERKGLFYRERNDTIPLSFDVQRLSRREDRILRRVRRDIDVSVDKKTNLVKIKVTSRSPQVAAALCSQVISGLDGYLRGYYYEKSDIDLEYLQVMTSQAQNEFYEAQTRYARAMDSGQGLSGQQARLYQERLRNEMSLASQLYEQIAKKEQAARIKAQENKPVLAVIQPAVLPYKGHPSRVKTVFILTFLAFAVSCVWVMFFKDEFKSAVTEEK
ncbi:MAG: Wzz/FepE/Etk N-terminal domain-containing protein [Bacteroidales bacterium]|nr:Wzz/FepE/Etk N-terminal domain-containing protein [Bacteroidales bacterium]